MSCCLPHLSVSHFGVNPTELLPNQLWQMDVTHIPEFGTLRFVYVTVDTYSGYIFATTHTGEKIKDVISHCLQAFATIGRPKSFKTDNGLAYTSSFQQFYSKFNIYHSTGLPYNPQGQAIVEMANQTLKVCLTKQKGEIGALAPPKDILNLVYSPSIF